MPAPIFASQIETVVFNPPWNVPASIANGEILPRAARDPGYLARNNFTYRDGRLQQQPGPTNSLGQVKFDMPSPFGVYLHDTPGRAAFARPVRTLSHGCMRLEKPRELATLLLASEDAIARHGLKPRARIVAHARNSLAPEDFTLAPIGAAEQVLAKAGWSASEVDLWEINEAFAMVTMLTTHALALDSACVNVHGGACAQGHPIGSTGSRIIVTLMHALEHYGKQRGVAALCIGGGEATAVAIELVS